jgi:hypothetical protein
VTPNPATFVTLLIAAVWLAGTGLAVTWWGGGAIGQGGFTGEAQPVKRSG